MRKHFLILMLMALLPLASFAIEEVEVRVYGGEQHFTYGTAYTVPEAVDPDMLVFMPYGLSDVVKEQVCSKLKFTWTANPLTTTSDAGTYGFTVSLINAGIREFFLPLDATDPADYTHHYVITVQDPDGSFIIDKATAPEATDVPTLKTEDLFYNGQEQDLLESKGTVADGFELEFSVDGGTTWSTEGAMVTNANLTGYTVTYRTKEKPNYNASASANLTAKVVGKGTVTLNPFTVVADGTYDGLEKQLITAPATTDFGTPTIKYQVQYRPTAQSATAWSSFPWSTKRTNINHNDFKRRLAGQYRIMALIEDDANVNDVSSSKVIVTINRAALTVKTDDKQKTYGEDDPALTVTYTGFKNNENADDLIAAGELIAPVLERADNTNNNVADGPYEISVTTLPTATNYTIEEDVDNRGHLTINPRELDLTSGDFTFTLEGSSFVFTGDEITTVVSSATFKGAAMTKPTDYTYVTTNNVHVGDANVVITGQGNFKGSVIKPFAITPKPVWIKPANAEKLYGTADPTPLTTYTIVDANYVPATATDPATEGAVIEGATLKGTVNFTREDGQNVGEYVITVSGYEPSTDPTEIDDYEPQITGSNYASKFTIKPTGAALVLKFKDDAIAEKYYGDANPAWGIDDLVYVSGLIPGDSWDAVKPTMSAPVFAIASENVNAENNKVTVSNLGSTNYPNVTVQDFAFTVKPRPIAVKVYAQTINYGNNVTSLVTDWDVVDADSHDGTALATIGATPDTKDDLTIQLSTDNAIATYGPGEYDETIKASILTNPNYELNNECEWGKLTVTGAALVLNDEETNIYDVIKANNGETQNVTIIFNRDQQLASETTTRTWMKEKWNSIVLPFDIEIGELSSKFGYAIFNVADPVNTVSTPKANVAFKIELAANYPGNVIPANTPLLIKTNKDIPDPYAVDFGTKTIVAPATAQFGYEINPTTKYKFMGTYAPMTVNAESEYADNIYFWTGTTDKPARISSTSTAGNTWVIKPFSAYVDQSVAPGAHDVELEFTYEELNGQTTAVKGISIDEINSDVLNEGIFNLNGVKMNNVPTQKGIYIMNGKKVVVK